MQKEFMSNSKRRFGGIVQNYLNHKHDVRVTIMTDMTS